MYLYINKQNEKIYPYSLHRLKKENPHVSFPIKMSKEELEDWGVFEVKQEAPIYDIDTQNVIEGVPELIEGLWTQTWVITQKTPEEINTYQQSLVPQSVTKRQGRQQMILMGILDQVQTAIDSISDTTQRLLVQSFWDDSTQYERTHPQMIQLAQAVGLTDEQLDQAFIAAAQL